MKTKVLVTLGVIAILLGVIITAAILIRNTISVGAQDAGKTITVSKGDYISVKLEGNLTTGYNWEALTIDPPILAQVGEPLMKPDSNAIGSGGMITLKFQAVQTGQTLLKLVYHRPWEKDVAPLQTFEITVVVK